MITNLWSWKNAPIAGAQVNPGDSMPATSINPFASSASSMTKSPPSSWARSPAKEVITFPIGRDGTLKAPFFKTSSNPMPVVLTPSFSSMSTAVGPANKLP